MTTKTEKDSAGKALYCEFRKDNYTFQLILTPNLVNKDNQVEGAYKVSRRISTYHPRRNWTIDKIHASRLPGFARDAYGEFEKVDLDTATAYAGLTIDLFYGNLFNNLTNQEWKLFKNPLAVEVTYGEIESLRTSKIPVSLYRRIERVRKNQGWAESLFNEEVA